MPRGSPARHAAPAVALLATVAGGWLPALAAVEPPAPEPPSGGVRVAVPHSAALLEPGLDPLLRIRRTGRALLGCGLYRLDHRGRARADLARHAVAVADGTAWEIDLRDGLRLADGSSLDASAVVRLWNDQVSSRPEASWLLAPLSRPPLAVSRLRVRFELRRPAPDLPARLAHPWLALVEPAADGRERSSLGPYRPLRRQRAGGGPPSHLLVARADHDHGSLEPVDLAPGPWPGGGMGRWCARAAAPYELVFAAGDRVPAALRRAAATGLATAGPAPAGPRPDRLASLEVLVPAGDETAAGLAAGAQARLLDRGLRLRIRSVAAADLERRLRAGRYHAAVIPLIPGLGDPLLDVEARLAATGLGDGAEAAMLERAASRPGRRARRRAAAAVLEHLRQGDRHLLVAREASCLDLDPEAASSALAWVTRLPVRQFKAAPRR